MAYRLGHEYANYHPPPQGNRARHRKFLLISESILALGTSFANYGHFGCDELSSRITKSEREVIFDQQKA